MPYEIYLSHHGIKGQEWGVRHGPPYPLAKGNAIKKKQKANYKRIKSKDYSDFDKKLNSLPAYKEGKKEIARIKKREAEYDNLDEQNRNELEAKTFIKGMERGIEYAEKNLNVLKEKSKNIQDKTSSEYISISESMNQCLIEIAASKALINQAEKEKKVPNVDDIMVEKARAEYAVEDAPSVARNKYVLDDASYDMYAEIYADRESQKFVDDYLGDYGNKRFIHRDSKSGKLTIATYNEILKGRAWRGLHS